MEAREREALLCERGRALISVVGAGKQEQDAHIRIGVDRDGVLPAGLAEACDVLLTTLPDPPRPWVEARDVDAAIAKLEQKIRSYPVASTTLAHVLRLGEAMSFEGALFLESLAFSTLLTGAEFRQWMRSRESFSSSCPSRETAVVRFEREGQQVTITLADPTRLNAYSARMRDELVEALENVLIDPTLPSVVLRGEGRAFCVGGELGEFGSASDMADAHLIRWTRSAAHLIHRLGERISVSLHGPCIGAGIEIAAAAWKIRCSNTAWFQLPEISMGLIPGAGGTVTIPRRIGRHRTLYLALTGKRLNARNALQWRLVDEVTEA